MRVLLVTNVFPPAIGGPATFGARLGEELVKNGHIVKVVCGTEDAIGKYRCSYPVTRTGFSGNILRRELAIRFQILKSAFSSDIVYCMGLEHQTAWACRVVRKSFVLRIGGDSVWEGARNLGVTTLEPEEYYTKTTQDERAEVQVPELRRRTQLNSAKAIVYVSNYLKGLATAWTQQRGHDERVILNGISTNIEKSIRVKKEGEPLRLLFVGRQTNWKGVDAVLLAIKDTDKVKLTVAGSGPMLPANIDLSRRLCLEKKVEFAGHVDPVDVEKLMHTHHALILLSLYEGLSNTLLEAGAAGLACISSNRAGNPEVIIHDETGILVDPFDIKEITQAINKLSSDDSERLRIAENHRRRVKKNFTLKMSVEQTIHVLEEAIDS